MASHAYIKLVSSSSQQEVTLEEVRKLLKYYREITGKTGRQLGWKYEEAAFPYEFAETPDGKGKWFYLRAADKDNYRYIVFAVDSDHTNNSEIQYNIIQVTLPDDATHGDKSKANEFSKFMAKKLGGELHLFNGRIMHHKA